MLTHETLRLLVVDDEEGMRLGIERGLQGTSFPFPNFDTEVHFEISLAQDGESALEKLKHQAFDLVLLDYMLPGINGLGVLDWIQNEQPDTTVVMITAFASLEVAVSATKNGAYDFLAKPFSPADLRHVVSKATQHMMTHREAARLAAEKHSIRFEFISVLAHELKSPLAAVENYLNLMDQRIAGNDLQAYDKSVKRSLCRLNGMRKIIMDLLDLTRLESGQLQADPEWVDLRELVNTSFEGLASLAAEKNVCLNSEFHGESKIFIAPLEAEILLNNFISNAIKYNVENGLVVVSVRTLTDEVQIDIRDTGIGMTEAETKLLFGEFVRIKNDKTRKIPGSGLGLSIAKKILKKLHGRVNVKSVPDEGTCFCVTIPLMAVGDEVLSEKAEVLN